MTAKKNDDRKVKNGGVEFITNQSSSHPKDSMTFLEWNMTRRDLMLQTALASLLLAFPWADSAFAAAPPPPKLSFVRNKTNDGIIGPYGEVRIFNVGGEALPAVISAFDGSALMDLTGRSPFVRFGASTDTTTITLTSSGVQFGAAKPEPWSADIVKKLIAAIVSDRKKARGALLLRSALHMSYPIAIAQTKSKVGSKVATAMAKGSAGYGIGAMKCTVTTVTDVVTKTITDSVAVVLTAEKQYQACVDREITKDPCKAAALVGLGGVCAAGICAAKEFVDIVTGWTTIVYTVGEVMTHQVVSCVLPKPGQWPNPWNLSDNLINTAVPAQPKVAFGAKEIANAQKVISAIIASIGQFGKCLSDAKWSLAQLDTTLNIGGKIVIPYGVTCLPQPRVRYVAYRLPGHGRRIGSGMGYRYTGLHGSEH